MKVDPSYAELVTHVNGKPVIYAELSKALYGTLQVALQFWQDLTCFLTENLGFAVNPYDWGVVNKKINRHQCTISWHFDDLKISHVDSSMVETIIESLNTKHRKETLLVVHHGPIQEYLGMTIVYSPKGKVSLTPS